jgi:hypothetical protein
MYRSLGSSKMGYKWGCGGGGDENFGRKVGRTRSRINGLKVSLTMETLMGKLVGLGVGWSDDIYFCRKVGRTRSRIVSLKIGQMTVTLVGKWVGLGVG